jgi:hypothetical protein
MDEALSPQATAEVSSACREVPLVSLWLAGTAGTAGTAREPFLTSETT